MRRSQEYWNIPCRSLIAFAISLFLTSVSWGQTSSLPSSQEQATTEVFILRQLIEMQNEIGKLREEVSALRKAVDETQSATAPALTAAPPASGPVKVMLDKDDPILGDESAKVAVVEFSDYQCPYCSRFHKQYFAGLAQRYIDTGKVKYVLRDFPLSFHSKAKGAAIAANCAGEQGAYWKMKESLFANQSQLGDPLYGKLAQELSLDSRRFAACLKSDDMAREVDEDFAYGQSVGVRGTPTFFVGRVEDGRLVNATRIVGSRGVAAFAQVIEPLLKGSPN